jgi:UDP-N-acetylglucosamine 2-epimerase (non-hydrolysing)
MLSLTAAAAAVLTDSGGLQEETTVLGVPCLTLREQAERPITITEGTNRLAPWALARESLLHACHDVIGGRRNGREPRTPRGWDGKASERIVAALAGSSCFGSSGGP